MLFRMRFFFAFLLTAAFFIYSSDGVQWGRSWSNSLVTSPNYRNASSKVGDVGSNFLWTINRFFIAAVPNRLRKH